MRKLISFTLIIMIIATGFVFLSVPQRAADMLPVSSRAMAILAWSIAVCLFLLEFLKWNSGRGQRKP